MATIAITSPKTGGTVNRPFTATGTYQSDEPFVSIIVVLKDSLGVVVATGFPTTVGAGSWDSVLSPQQAYNNASVEATIVGTTTTDSVGNITVS